MPEFNPRQLCMMLIGTLVGVVFEYDTPKYVHIRNKKVGLLNRFVQLLIVGYTIGYGIVWQHGAQKMEAVQSVVTTKIKGVSPINDSRPYKSGCSNDWTVLDHVDLIVPPTEPNSFFVTTNMWVTCNQKYGECPEDPGVPDARCTSDDDCTAGVLPRTGNGIMNGTCNTTVGSCIIEGWCPTEDENDTLTAEGPVIDTEKFTVLVKNTISFPHLDKNYRVRNIPASVTNGTILKHCQFDPNTEDGRVCPIFSLKQIVDMINSSDSYYETLATEGAVVGLEISWDCNLDISSSHCQPKYSARRLDNPDSLVSPGFNFRYPKYYRVDGEEVRDVWKVYGIKFMVQVSGQGRKFDFFTLVLALGSMIALLAIATTVTDIFALYLLKRGKHYRDKKYQKVSFEEQEMTHSTLNNKDSETSPILGNVRNLSKN